MIAVHIMVVLGTEEPRSGADGTAQQLVGVVQSPADHLSFLVDPPEKAKEVEVLILLANPVTLRHWRHEGYEGRLPSPRPRTSMHP